VGVVERRGWIVFVELFFRMGGTSDTVEGSRGVCNVKRKYATTDSGLIAQ
jgi:hypothetical protein